MAFSARSEHTQRNRGATISRKGAAALTAAVLAMSGAVAFNSAAPARADDTVKGCSYGTGGPAADALCWINIGAFGEVTAADLAKGPVSKPLTINLGDYTFTATATVSAGANGANGINAVKLPTWGGSVLGSNQVGQDYYVGTTGQPAFYQRDDAGNSVTHSDSERDTVTLSDIKVFDTKNNNAPVTSGYSLVVADAESTDDGEGFIWKTDSSWETYQKVVPEGWQEPCGRTLTGVGASPVECVATENPPSGGRGIIMMSAEAPTWVSSAFRNQVDNSSRQGIAFALVFTTVNAKVQVNQDGGSNAAFTVKAKGPTGEIGETTTADKETQLGLQQLLSNPDGSTIDYSVSKTGGDTPETAYDIAWECFVNGAPFTPTITDGVASIKVPANGTGTCKATATAKAPKANPDRVVVDQHQPATLTPVTEKGKGDLTKVTFDNGETTKKVDGQGTWDIKLDNGQPVATFTPEKGFTGPVTQQKYTVTDSNKLTATSTLDVIIKPITGDDTKTINPNQTAELAPVTVKGSGDITKAVFDNEETTKVVKGEGTWTIKVVDAKVGKVQSTFTPEKDYFGKVTPQPYTITDTNSLTATGTLSVKINVPPVAKPDAVTINKGETAHLTPETIPGTGPLTKVTFDNGETTKVVKGEGTWTIELVDGKVKATFVPENGYTGPVTQQKYTVTDTNELTATSTLDVTILKPTPPTPSPAPKPGKPGLPSTGV